MFDLRRLLARVAKPPRAQGDLESDFGPPSSAGDGLEFEYRALITNQLRRCGIDPACVKLEVQNFGQAGDGCDVFVCMVQLTTWGRVAALRLLLGLPMLEARVRRSINTTWLADISHFGGLWVHASQHLHGTPGTDELRDLIKQLTPS